MKLRKAPPIWMLGLTATLYWVSTPPIGAAADPIHHGHHARSEGYQRTLKAYSVPDVTLLDQDGAKVRLKELIDSGRPVLLNFLFTTCSTICPVLSAGFSSFQNKLGAAAGHATLISISIDPDHDTPPILKAFLERHGAKPGWHFLTGSYEDIARVRKAFDAYAENKMDHRPLTFLHASGANKWVRINGLIGASNLADEYHKLPRT